MKGLSPLIATLILIGLVVMLGAMLGPWMMGFIRHQTQNTENDTVTVIKCQNAAYDFDTSYGNLGVTWDFSGSPDTLTAKIYNTGSVSMYGFKLEFYIDNSGTPEIKIFDLTQSTQKTESDPLKPGESAILSANITEDVSGVLQEVTIINAVCTQVHASQEF